MIKSFNEKTKTDHVKVVNNTIILYYHNRVIGKYSLNNTPIINSSYNLTVYQIEGYNLECHIVNNQGFIINITKL
jgi:hypothetical protein